MGWANHANTDKRVTWHVLSLSTCTNNTCPVFGQAARQDWKVNLEQMCPVTFYKYKSARHTNIHYTETQFTITLGKWANSNWVNFIMLLLSSQLYSSEPLLSLFSWVTGSAKSNCHWACLGLGIFTLPSLQIRNWYFIFQSDRLFTHYFRRYRNSALYSTVV